MASWARAAEFDWSINRGPMEKKDGGQPLKKLRQHEFMEGSGLYTRLTTVAPTDVNNLPTSTICRCGFADVPLGVFHSLLCLIIGSQPSSVLSSATAEVLFYHRDGDKPGRYLRPRRRG